MLRLSEIKSIVSDNYLNNFSEFYFDAYSKNNYFITYVAAKEGDENDQILVKLFQTYSDNLLMAQISVGPFPRSYSLTYLDEECDNGLLILKTVYSYNNSVSYSALMYDKIIKPNELCYTVKDLKFTYYEKKDYSLIKFGRYGHNTFRFIYDIIEKSRGKHWEFSFKDVIRIVQDSHRYFITFELEPSSKLNITYLFDSITENAKVESLMVSGSQEEVE